MNGRIDRRYLNSVIPDVWIIEEKLRRERERRKKDHIPLEIEEAPISLPHNEDDAPEKNNKKHDTEEHVIIIDL